VTALADRLVPDARRRERVEPCGGGSAMVAVAGGARNLPTPVVY
jgi:hypothetical protein